MELVAVYLKAEQDMRSNSDRTQGLRVSNIYEYNVILQYCIVVCAAQS